MKYLSSTRRNPFGLDPPCERAVPGFGDPNAHFHVVGDNPAVHGGLDLGIPFTGRPWSAAFFEALVGGGLVESVDLSEGRIEVPGTFFSYLSMCSADGEEWAGNEDSGYDGASPEEIYDEMEPYFDAELRAITAHVLLTVGERATKHIFDTYTSIAIDGDFEMEEFHARDFTGAGWLVVPIAEPAVWDGDEGARLESTLSDLLDSDYRQTSDLGRFLPDDEPYFVR